MTCAIQKDVGVYLCTSNTGLPRWGELKTMSALMTFADAAACEEYMDKCQTIEFDDGCVAVEINFIPI
jgi:hypothetical protein